VAKYFDDIVKSGWRQELLSVKEYNLIILLIDFFNKMSNITKSTIISYKDFFLMEEAFLKLTYKEENKKLLMNGLDKYITFYSRLFNKEKIQKEEINKKLNYFFSFNLHKPSFFDLILAFNMVYYKRYLEWEEIISPHESSVIQTDFYDCPKEVFYEIVEHMKGLVKEIKELEKEKQQIEWLKSFHSSNLPSCPEKVIKFYTKIGHVWNNDREDILLMLLLLIKGIIRMLDEFLHKEWEIMTDKEKIIRISLASLSDLATLCNRITHEYELANEHYMTMLPAKITLTDFVSKEYPTILFASKSQRVIYEKIEIILESIQELAIIFKNLLENKNNDEKSKFTEYTKYMIVKPEEWCGKPVYALFNYYIELFLQICGYFKEKNLHAKIQKLQLLNAQIIEKSRLKKALDVNHYLEKHLVEGSEHG
jgi:hypothetical protein